MSEFNVVANVCVCVGVRYVPDTDDEHYENKESEDTDTSDDSNTSDNKDDKHTTTVSMDTQSSELKRRLSDDDDDRAVTDRNSVHCKDASSVERVSVEKEQVKQVDDEELAADSDVAVDKKRRKLEDGTKESTSDVNSHGMYRCWEVAVLVFGPPFL